MLSTIYSWTRAKDRPSEQPSKSRLGRRGRGEIAAGIGKDEKGPTDYNQLIFFGEKSMQLLFIVTNHY